VKQLESRSGRNQGKYLVEGNQNQKAGIGRRVGRREQKPMEANRLNKVSEAVPRLKPVR
jgi:hypothetical protein